MWVQVPPEPCVFQPGDWAFLRDGRKRVLVRVLHVHEPNGFADCDLYDRQYMTRRYTTSVALEDLIVIKPLTLLALSATLPRV